MSQHSHNFRRNAKIPDAFTDVRKNGACFHKSINIFVHFFSQETLLMMSSFRCCDAAFFVKLLLNLATKRTHLLFQIKKNHKTFASSFVASRGFLPPKTNKNNALLLTCRCCRRHHNDNADSLSLSLSILLSLARSRTSIRRCQPAPT